MCPNNSSSVLCGTMVDVYRKSTKAKASIQYCVKTRATILYGIVQWRVVPPMLSSAEFEATILPHLRVACNLEHGPEFDDVVHSHFADKVRDYAGRWAQIRHLWARGSDDTYTWNQHLIAEHCGTVETVEAWLRSQGARDPWQKATSDPGEALHGRAHGSHGTIQAALAASMTLLSIANETLPKETIPSGPSTSRLPSQPQSPSTSLLPSQPQSPSISLLPSQPQSPNTNLLPSQPQTLPRAPPEGLTGIADASQHCNLEFNPWEGDPPLQATLTMPEQTDGSGGDTDVDPRANPWGSTAEPPRPATPCSSPDVAAVAEGQAWQLTEDVEEDIPVVAIPSDVDGDVVDPSANPWDSTPEPPRPATSCSSPDVGAVAEGQAWKLTEDVEEDVPVVAIPSNRARDGVDVGSDDQTPALSRSIWAQRQTPTTPHTGRTKGMPTSNMSGPPFAPRTPEASRFGLHAQTPDTPKTPSTPWTPWTPQTLWTPSTPQTPHTPQTPQTPSRCTGSASIPVIFPESPRPRRDCFLYYEELRTKLRHNMLELEREARKQFYLGDGIPKGRHG
ncbi:hypothetical protein QBC39DRAFT_158720 [Podospora conica]|nr:hypothetical protein QBC39DRAFT_158720 [Schizothecium conicum]